MRAGQVCDGEEAAGAGGAGGGALGRGPVGARAGVRVARRRVAAARRVEEAELVHDVGVAEDVDVGELTGDAVVIRAEGGVRAHVRDAQVDGEVTRRRLAEVVEAELVRVVECRAHPAEVVVAQRRLEEVERRDARRRILVRVVEARHDRALTSHTTDRALQIAERVAS